MSTFYHIGNTDKRTLVGRVFCNNVLVHKGYLTAESYMRLKGSGYVDHGSKSPYEIFNREKEKEDVFEQIRVESFPCRPPRLGSLWLFDSLKTAEECDQEWCKSKGLSTTIFEADIVKGNFDRFDLRYLDGPKPQWRINAMRYWQGSLSENPAVEVLVQGTIKLLDWEKFGGWEQIGVPTRR